MYSSNIMKSGMNKENICDFLSEFISSDFDCIDEKKNTKSRVQKLNREKTPTEIIYEAENCAKRIIKDAKDKSADIISEAKKEADFLFTEAKEKGRESGFNEGYQFGEKAALDVGINITEELKAISNCLAAQRDEFLANSKDIIIELAFDIAAKVVADDFFGDNGAFYKVFGEAVKKIPPAKKLMLTVSDNDFEVAMHNKQRLLDIAKDFENIEIKKAGYDEDGLLMLESPIMLIDASLNLQLELLKSSLS